MCGRLSLFLPLSILEDRFTAEFVTEYVQRYNVAPRQDLYAVTNEAPSSIDAFEWGLLPGSAADPDDSPRPINARAETVAEKRPFRDAFADRRCLVLADGFYEWKGGRGSTEPYRVRRRDERPLAFAGLWEAREARGETRRRATILTTEANDTVAPIHDRMPVVLDESDEDDWLHEPDPVARRALLDPVDPGTLEAYPVSTDVNDPANDRPAVVEPLDTEQSGFDEFR